MTPDAISLARDGDSWLGMMSQASGMWTHESLRGCLTTTASTRGRTATPVAELAR